MTSLKNDTFLRALGREKTDYTPVWIMRQAGRYLPEYRALRAEAGSFMALCTNPELACEVTLQPLRRFPLDAAIIFSDILTIPDAMGLGLNFTTGQGPSFERPLRSRSDIENLPTIDPEDDLPYVMAAVKKTRLALAGEVPLVGFSGSPWTLATYMIEGSSSKTWARAKALIFEQPELAHQLLGKLADAVTDYLNAQIRAGAQAVQIFDTWGGALPWAEYREFSLAYMQRIIAGLIRENEGRRIPVILFSKGCGHQLGAIADSGCDAAGVDWTMRLSEARGYCDDRIALQGNMDPAILLTNPETIRRYAKQTLADFGDGPGHIFNLGHGITPDVPPEHLACLVAAVHEFSGKK